MFRSVAPLWEKVLSPPTNSAKKKRAFDPMEFLATIGEGRKAVPFPKKQPIFAQGDAADSIFYIQAGKVRLTVVSQIGKEATLGILSEGDFFGEGGLAGQPLRMGSATAMTDCERRQIDKKAMMLALHREHTFSDLFVAYLLAPADTLRTGPRMCVPGEAPASLLSCQFADVRSLSLRLQSPCAEAVPPSPLHRKNLPRSICPGLLPCQSGIQQ